MSNHLVAGTGKSMRVYGGRGATVSSSVHSRLTHLNLKAGAVSRYQTSCSGLASRSERLGDDDEADRNPREAFLGVSRQVLSRI